MQTNINQFLRQFGAHKKIALETSAKVLNATILTMYKKIVDRTPVGDPSLWHYPAPAGYVPGTLKASWKIDFGTAARGTGGRFISSSSIVAGHGITFSVSAPSTQGVNIHNDVPYAQRVEMGWSTQAPYGMMRISIAEYTSILNGNAAKYRIK